jgi:cation diffusion facilitator CzcD-associated flavoprotein CzcO
MTTDISPVVIVGAGLSGLAAAHALERRGIVPRILDADPRPGETWRRRHPQLRLNTHRRHSALPGLPLSGDDHPYPHRDEVAAYLERYAGRLKATIEHGVRVEAVAQAEDVWTLSTTSGLVCARNVVIATGVDREPHVPAWPVLGAWPGTLIHSADLGDVRRFAGKRVLVVGAGNSGCDVINQLVQVDTAELLVSVRHGPSVIPKWIGRFPMMRLSPLLARIPAALLDPLVAGWSRLVFGDLTRHGLPRHPLGLSRRLKMMGIAPAIDDGMVAALQSGRLKVVPEIACFREDGVLLEDQRIVTPHVVIAATGYRTGLHRLFAGVNAVSRRGIPYVNGGAQLDHLPGLFFTGMRPSLSGFFLASARSGEEIARAVARREKAASPDVRRRATGSLRRRAPA